MNNGNIWFIIKLLPLLAATAIIFSFIGWWLRCKLGHCGSQGAQSSGDDSAHRDRIRKLEDLLKNAEGANKAVKSEMEVLRLSSIDKSKFDTAAAALVAANSSISSDRNRITLLEADLKKAQAALQIHNSKSNESNKQDKDKLFALENELSKTREELAQLKETPDDTAHLKSEVNRLQDALSNATRVAGEMRKRETAASEALAKCEARIGGQETKNEATILPLFTTPPVRSADELAKSAAKVAAAKAEVERLNLAKSQQEQSVVSSVESVLVSGMKNDVATSILGKLVKQDDFKIVEGIGPKIEELIHEAGITTWTQLAETSAAKLEEILTAAGERFAIHNPSTWPRQSELASKGEWLKLKDWQDSLDGGKE
jgi:predicted flap endonuclease-1-like 5' DNA nuclease